MCHRGPMGPQGYPLNENTLSNMTKEEQSFWKEDFFPLVNAELAEAEKNGKDQPYQPSKKLKTIMQKAIEEYNGKAYCPVQQILDIFDFPIS